MLKGCYLLSNFLSSTHCPRLPLATAGRGWRRGGWGGNTLNLCQTSGVQAEAESKTGTPAQEPVHSARKGRGLCCEQAAHLVFFHFSHQHHFQRMTSVEKDSIIHAIELYSNCQSSNTKEKQNTKFCPFHASLTIIGAPTPTPGAPGNPCFLG